MASKGQLKLANRFVRLVQAEKKIHKFDLMDKLSISIATYDKIKPYVEYRYPHYVEFDSKSKIWTGKEVVFDP